MLRIKSRSDGKINMNVSFLRNVTNMECVLPQTLTVLDTETVNSVQLLRWDLKHHQNVSLRQHEFRAWVVWPLMWTISMFMFITSARSAQCCNGLWKIYSKTVIKEGLKRTTSWVWKVLCKDIWINLGIDTDSRHNCLWFLVWCDWGPSSWSMRCSPLKKTFVWLTKTWPKEEKFNKLN